MRVEVIRRITLYVPVNLRPEKSSRLLLYRGHSQEKPFETVPSKVILYKLLAVELRE